MNAYYRQKSVLVAVGLFSISFLLLALSTTQQSLWFLILIGLVPLFFAIEKTSGVLGWIGANIVGFGYLWVIFYPISTINAWWWTFSTGFFWEYRNIMFLVFFGILAIICTLFTFSPIFILYIKWLKSRPLIGIFCLPLCWVILEIIRVYLFSGLEWGIFGQPLAENLLFARSARFGSLFALTFIAIITNYCVFLILRGFFGKKLKDSAVPLFSLLLILIILLINSRIIVAKVDLAQENNQTNLKIALISPELKTQEIMSESGIQHIFNLITEAVSEKPELIILPENIFPTIIIDEKTNLPVKYGKKGEINPVFKQISNISALNPDISFIIGLHSQNDEMSFNSAVVFEKGRVVSIYNKQVLLPFTEKSPEYIKNLHIKPLSKGNRERRVQTQYGDFLPFICSETLQSSFIQNFPRKKQENNQKSLALINLSNDSVFNSYRVASYNKLMAKIRAIESNSVIIRSAKGGFSGIFDPSGREISPMTIKSAEVLVIELKI